MLKPVNSLNELYRLASKDKQYEALMICAAENLGGVVNSPADARQVLNNNAMESGDEDSVLDEVNFCRDLVP